MVCGEGRAFLIALIVPDAAYLTAERRRELGLAAGGAPDAGQLAALMRKRAARLHRAFPSYARVRRFVIVDEAWTVENGLLTPTLKIRRRQIAARHSEAITAAFAAIPTT